MNLKRSLALALSVMLILSMALPAAIGAGESLERLKGANKWETAVAISQEGWDSADAVVLANGDKFADALAGVPLAHVLDAPILLTPTGNLVKVAKDEIVRLGATEVYILGGTAAISSDVENELKDMGLEVTRVKGSGRAETAVEISKLVAPDGTDTVVLVYAWDFPDALAAASYAAVAGYPILLTEKTHVPEVTLQAIEDLGATNIIVVGGTAVISEDAVKNLEGVERISGSNREATSVELAKRFAPDATMFYIATGDGFADAIAGAALAAKNGTGIILVRKSLHKTVADFLNEKVYEVVIFGGTAAVSADVEKAIQGKLVVPDTGVAGFVYDEQGDPVEDVVVTVGNRSATTDEDGFYFVPGVAPGEYEVTAELTGWQPAEADVVVVADGVSVLNIEDFTELSADAIQIHATVYNSSTHASVEDFEVTLEMYDKDKGKWVDAVEDEHIVSGTGSFYIVNTSENLEFGGEYRLTVTKNLAADNEDDVYHPFTKVITLDKFANRTHVAVALDPVKEATITGVVKDADGEEVEGVTVELHFDKDQDPFEATTDEDGKFEFEGAYPKGTYTIMAELPGHAVYSKSINLNEGAELTHNIQFQPGYEVELRLGASPVGTQFKDGSTATAKLYQGEALIQEGAVEVTADLITITFGDDEGADRYGIAAGTYTVEVSGDYLVTTEFTIKVSKSATTFTNRIARAGTVSGTVTKDADGPNAIAKATVVLLKGDKEVDSVETGADGTYEFVGVPAGKYTVEVSAKNFKTAATDDEITVEVNKDTTEVDFVLEAVVDTGTITGILREQGTMDLIGDGVDIWFLEWDEDEEEWVEVTDAVYADGKYTATLKAGDYLMLIEYPGEYELIYQKVTITAEKTLTKNFVLTPGGDGTLALVDEDGDPVDYTDIATVSLTDEYGVEHGFLIDGKLSAGTYTLKITMKDDSGYENIEKTVKIAKGKTTEFEVKFVELPAKTTVNFHVLAGFPGSGVNNAKLAVHNAAGKLIAYTDFTDNGQVSIDLEDGVYTVKVYAHGHLVDSKSVTVKYDDGKAIDVPVFYLTEWE